MKRLGLILLALSVLIIPIYTSQAQDGNTIRLDERKLGEINATTGHPIYVFSATANQTVTIDITAITPQLALSFTVLTPNDALVVAVGNPSQQSRVTDTITFATPGDYKIQVNNVSNVEGQFIISIFRPVSEVPAETVVSGTSVQDELSQGARVVYGITANTEAPASLTVTTMASAFGVDVNLQDESGTTVAFVSNALTGMTLTIPAGNMNYLLTLSNNNPVGTPLRYTVSYGITIPDDSAVTPAPTAADLPPSPTAEATDENELPSLPSNGPCVLATQGQIVNVRAGPAMEYDVVTTIGAYTVYDVLGRNDDSSWYQIDAKPEIGWVAVRVTRQGGDCDELELAGYPPLGSTISGIVWHDLCATPDEPVDEPPEGCIETAEDVYAGDGVRSAGEPNLAGVEVLLNEGACPGVAFDSAVTTSSGYSFVDLGAGTYCVSVNATSATNSSILIPGGWTSPRTTAATAQFTINLDAGEDRSASFGWDFQFAP